MCNYMRNLTFEMFPKVVCYWYTSPCYHPYSSYKIVYSAVYNNQECTSNGEHNRSVHFLSFNFSQLVSFTTTDSKKNPKQTNIHLKPAICLIKLSTSKQSQFLISQDSQCELKVQLCLCLSRFTEWTRYPVGDMLHVQERYATHMFTRTQMNVSACQSVRCNETYVQSWVWKQSCVRFLKTAEWSFAAEAKCCRLTCSNMFSSCVINAVSLADQLHSKSTISQRSDEQIGGYAGVISAPKHPVKKRQRADNNDVCLYVCVPPSIEPGGRNA